LGFDRPDDEVIRFWVRDNGPGLTPDQQAQLFRPFTRVGQANVEGHGLGLSIVQRIAERLHGEVGVESQVGQGSLFYFTLPAAPGLSG
jgi:two-component system sensor histidine kinase/response regulator